MSYIIFYQDEQVALWLFAQKNETGKSSSNSSNVIRLFGK